MRGAERAATIDRIESARRTSVGRAFGDGFFKISFNTKNVILFELREHAESASSGAKTIVDSNAEADDGARQSFVGAFSASSSTSAIDVRFPEANCKIRSLPFASLRSPDVRV